MFRMICLLIGYAIGLIQTAFIVGKLMGKIDIRDYGSGNAGTTNVMRTLGPKAAAIVFCSDVLKGVVGFILCTLLFSGDGTFFGSGNMNIVPGLYGGIGVILGHSFPFYLKFKGGKGIASSLGVILCINFKLAIIVFLFGMVVVTITKYISAASLTMTLLLPIAIFLFKYSMESVMLGTVITMLSWYLHRGNIKRLLTGSENKFSFSKKMEVLK